MENLICQVQKIRRYENLIFLKDLYFVHSVILFGKYIKNNPKFPYYYSKVRSVYKAASFICAYSYKQKLMVFCLWRFPMFCTNGSETEPAKNRFAARLRLNKIV
jgi:hypothetical protein